MEKVTVVIQSLEDARSGKPLIKGGTSENTYETTEPITFTFLEGGMQSGATSLGVVMKDKEGNNVFGQLTPGHLKMLNQVLKGVQERFGK
jgi:hypothetical protein